MPKQTKTEKARTQVKDLPKKVKKLKDDESKKVKGGVTRPATTAAQPLIACPSRLVLVTGRSMKGLRHNSMRELIAGRI